MTIQDSFARGCPEDDPDRLAPVAELPSGDIPALLQFPRLLPKVSLDIIKGLKSGSPVDPCPTKLLALVATVLNPVVNKVLNSSLVPGHMPSIWKHAKILPLLKKPSADPKVLANYRPISLLPFFSKVL